MTAAPGTLLLVPNTLDALAGPRPAGALDRSLPHDVIRRAASLAHWVVENAKSARAFLKRVDAVAPLALPLPSISIVELPRPPKGPGRAARAAEFEPLLAPLLAGHDVGLLSEAGLPGVADPGAALVAAAHGAGLRVWPLAGPSAITLALAASGLEGQSFAFVGYLPTEAAARATRLRELEAQSRRLRQTQIAIETPYRNAALFDALLANLAPATRLAASVGLTLDDGWCRTETVARWREARPALPGDLPAVFAWLAP